MGTVYPWRSCVSNAKNHANEEGRFDKGVFKADVIKLCRYLDQSQSMLEQKEEELESLKDMCRFLASCFEEVNKVRGAVFESKTIEEAKELAVFKWPLIQGTSAQLKVHRISKQQYTQEGITKALKLLNPCKHENHVMQPPSRSGLLPAILKCRDCGEPIKQRD